MKNLFFALALLFSLTFVSADLLQVNNFVYNNSPISNVGVLGFSCSNVDCSSGQIQFANLNSGSNSYLDIVYPNNGQSTHYGLFVFKDGYIPYERTSTGYEDISGDKRVDAVSDYLTKKDACTSTLTNLVVTNSSNVVTIKTNISSPINHSGGLNFVPAQITSQYSTNVSLFLKINNSINQTKIVNLPFSGSSEQSFSVTLSSGVYNFEVISVSSDGKCLSSINQSKISSFNLVNTTIPPTTCTSFVYNPWSACVGGIQTRTVNTSSPAGCVDGSPILTQTCSITDTTAPILNLPSTIYVNTTNNSGAIVSFNVNATDNIDSNPAVSCIPSSGSLFSLGTTTVFCNATDSSGNKGNGTFNVAVNLINNSNQTNNTSIFSVNITSPLNTTYNITNLPLNYSINGTATSCWYSLNGFNITLVQCGNTTISAINGTNNLTVFVSNGTDLVNNSVSFFVNLSSVNDTTAPIITIHTPTNITYSSNNTKINVSLNENGSCFYNLNNGINKSLSISNDFFLANETLANGQYLLTVFCSDLYGNTNQSNVHFRINVSKNNDDNSDDKKTFVDLGGYVLYNNATGNQTSDSLVLNKETKEISPWALFLVLLMLCVLVLFFIVLVLLIKDKEKRK